MANFNCVTGAPAFGQPFCPCLCCPCCLGDSFLSASSGITVTHYDAVVGKLAPVAIPLLVSLGPCFQPCYKLSDATGVCCVATDPKRPSASSKPVVIFAKRTVADLSTYTAAFTKYGTAAMEGTGVRACFSFVDRDTDNTVVQFTWADSASDLPAVPADLAACYAGGPESDFCVVWGGWDAAVKEALEADPKCKYEFGTETRGFLKSPGAETAAGFATGSPPMIWISKRPIKKGRMGKCGKNFQAGTDMMYPNAPAALGICEFTDPDDDHSSWSLRVFNHYEYAFKAHFPVPSWILFRMVFNVIPEWVPGLFPIGFSFSAKKDIEKAVASNGGNAAYKQYYWDKDIIGPKPDFAKGF